MDDYGYPAPDMNPSTAYAGPTPPPAPRRRWPRVAASLGVAAGVAIGAAALAGAATTPSRAPAADTPTTTPPNNTPPHKPGPGFKGRGGFGGPGIHGEFVVPAPNGGYETLANQVGTVTAVSSASISVKSEDGFERTYVVDENTVVDAGRDGISNVSKDDQVRVAAVVTGSTAKAVQVDDVTTLKQHRGTWAPGKPKAPSTPPASTP